MVGIIAATKLQIPSDLVVKSQATDIIDLILQLIRHQNGVYRSCRSRTPRGAVLSTSEAKWATTKFDGVCARQQTARATSSSAEGHDQSCGLRMDSPH